MAAINNNFRPILNEGIYVFVTITDLRSISRGIAIMEFKEVEGWTLILHKSDADRLGLSHEHQFAWITLSAETQLNEIGVTALFSNALAHKQISCNVVAGFYHDHIFVDHHHRQQALEVISRLTLPNVL